MQGAERTGDEVMTKRNGISLVNVMVFMLFAAMVTAQVFFFMSSSMDSIGEEREIMMYRLRLDTLVEEAKKELEKPENIGTSIKHDENLNNNLDDDTNKLTYATFFDGNGSVHTQTKYWDGSAWKNWDKKENSDWDEEETYYAVIFDLDYKFNAIFNKNDRDDYIENYSGYKKVFAAMLPETEEKDVSVLQADGTTVIEVQTVPVKRYYLIRTCAKLPQKFYGQHLMYQVLVRRNEDNNEVDTLSFQEVWF